MTLKQLIKHESSITLLNPGQEPAFSSFEQLFWVWAADKTGCTTEEAVWEGLLPEYQHPNLSAPCSFQFLATIIPKEHQGSVIYKPVIATMRDLCKKGKLEAAAGDTLNQTLSIQRLDVCSDESVAECINCLPEKQLDVLVNNAGVGLIGPLETISIDAMKHIFETNFFGAIRMIKAVLPAMKQRQKGHIVVISSVMGLQGIPFNDVYAASKFAIEGFCESLAVQLLKFNIFISLIEPGPINTDFEMKLMEKVAKSQFPGVDATTVHYFKEIYLPASHEIFSTMGQSPESVAKAVVSVIEKERPPFRTQTNLLYTPLVALKYADTSGELSVSTYYNLLFRFTRLFYISTNFLKCITCRCFRRQITPT